MNYINTGPPSIGTAARIRFFFFTSTYKPISSGTLLSCSVYGMGLSKVCISLAVVRDLCLI